MNNAAAIAEFLAAKAEIDALIAKLAAKSDDHFGANPDKINYGHVGTLQHIAAQLREIAA